MAKIISLLKLDKQMVKHWLNNGWGTVKKADGEKDYKGYKFCIKTEIYRKNAKRPKDGIWTIAGYKKPYKNKIKRGV